MCLYHAHVIFCAIKQALVGGRRLLHCLRWQGNPAVLHQAAQQQMLPLDLRKTYSINSYGQKNRHTKIYFSGGQTLWLHCWYLLHCSVVVPSNLKMVTVSTVLENSWSTNGGIENPCWSFLSSVWYHRSLSAKCTIFLDALASLDLKLTVSHSVIHLFS